MVGLTLLTNKLCGSQCPKSDAEKPEMIKIPYASTVRSLMYGMVPSTRELSISNGGLVECMLAESQIVEYPHPGMNGELVGIIDPFGRDEMERQTYRK